MEATEPANTPTSTSRPQATTTALRAAQPHPMASLLTALPAASKHTPRSPVNLSVRAGDDTPASLTTPTNQKSRPSDTANTEKHATALVRASPYTPKTDAIVVGAAAHLQPTQQQRKHANRVRNGLAERPWRSNKHTDKHITPSSHDHRTSRCPTASYGTSFDRPTSCQQAHTAHPSQPIGASRTRHAC